MAQINLDITLKENIGILDIALQCDKPIEIDLGIDDKTYTGDVAPSQQSA